MDNGAYAKVIAEILKRLKNLEKENENLRALVNTVRATLVRHHYVIKYSDRDVGVWRYYMGNEQQITIREVYNSPEHIKYGRYKYPEHGFQITSDEKREVREYIHPVTREITASPCFLSLSDAENFIRGFFTGNPDMCVIVDADPCDTIKDINK